VQAAFGGGVPAAAAGKPRTQSSFGSGAPGALLTRERLRACLARQARVAQVAAALPKETASVAVNTGRIGT